MITDFEFTLDRSPDDDDDYDDDNHVDYDMCPNCGGLHSAVNEMIHGWSYECRDCSNTWFVEDPRFRDSADEDVSSS